MKSFVVRAKYSMCAVFSCHQVIGLLDVFTADLSLDAFNDL